jgi:lipid II:glycine glycyltransferase (peptidoglycan interpeptide bridge formation enzyme)
MILTKKKKTIIIDLEKNVGEIRRNFHQKWRNCLNKVEKQNLFVQVGKDNEIFKRFVPLFNDFVAQKAFTVDLGIDFYSGVHKQSTDPDKYLVSLVMQNGLPIAGHVASILGDTCVYLLGATNDVGRKFNAAYLLQWNAIKVSKEAGCRWYDLGGIDAKGNPGVYRFKNRMGGKEVDICGPYEMQPRGYRPSLTRFGEKIFNIAKPYLVRS